MLYTSCSQSRVSFDSNKPSYLFLFAYAVGAFALRMLCLLGLPVLMISSIVCSDAVAHAL